MLNTHIIILGYMGCGKSTIAKKLSSVLGISHVDLDKQIELSTKMSISDFFNINGEIDNIDPTANIVGISFIEREAFIAAKQLFQVSAIQIIEKLPLFIPKLFNRSEALDFTSNKAKNKTSEET